MDRPLAVWLLICCLTIFAMVVLGGVTRLTGSGLSMVEWKPIRGVVPPLSHAAWQEIFQRYQQSPEYKFKNFHMGLKAFKPIFWFEYAHRLLGRVIGLLFLLPLLYFLLNKRIDKRLIPKLIALFIGGGLQGLLGWYMVKSGLIHQPQVSQYRLTAHLLLAFVIYACLFWLALDVGLPRLPSASGTRVRGIKILALTVTGVVFITALSGGFVAGLKAGFIYNTFPLMAGQWIPPGLFALEPFWRNFFENLTLVQFDHRLLATLLVVLIPLLWLKARPMQFPRRIRWGLHTLLLLLGMQIGLGITALLLHVPVPLAAGHQAGALALFTAALFVSHTLVRHDNVDH